MSQATRPNDRHIIWSNQNLDVDDWRVDYKEFLEANELDDDPNDEQALYEWMVETNDDYLSDERMNLNVQLSQPIIAIGDIGRWNGRVMGYKDIPSGNIRDCLYADTDYAAIITLRKCQEENRFATPDEQIILSKYVGWGGIPEVFDERADSWRTEYGMLKNILTPEEYASARESTLTAFYTPPTVINAVYKVMKQLGFREGNILEPSCGIGHFIGMLPEEMKEIKIYGVELDTVSAGIAQQLYQKSSIAAQGFEETNLPDSFFDAVVGNYQEGQPKEILREVRSKSLQGSAGRVRKKKTGRVEK